MTALRQAIEVAHEDLLLNAHRAEVVFNWFGERRGDRLAAFYAASAQLLEAALNGPAGQPVELDPAFHGDWSLALVAGWAMARLGRAHPAAPPFVTVEGDVTTLGAGDLTVVVGPLRLTGHVKVHRLVVIAGSLEVDGLLDFCGNPGDCLIVVGSERVRALDVGWGHFVLGSLDTDVTRWSYDALNEGLRCVTGASRERLTIENHHGSYAEAQMAADPANPLRALLDPRVDGPLDSARFCELIGRGAHRLVLDAEPRKVEIPRLRE